MSENPLKSQTIEAVLEPNFLKQYEVLYNKAKEFGKKLLFLKQNDLEAFYEETNKLFNNMKKMSEEMEKSGNYLNYNWLEKAAMDWQEIFSFILPEPRNVRDEIALPPRPSNLPRSQKRSEIPFPRIKSNLEAFAYRIGEGRKWDELKKSIQEFEKNPSLIYQKFPSSEVEKNNDWDTATYYFALSVLTGGLDLVYQLDYGAYDQLEKIYLGKVKKLSAYHKWQVIGTIWETEEEMEKDYLTVCDYLNQKLINTKIKAPASDFSNICSYLTNKYYTDNKLSPFASWNLTSTKARKIWLDKGSPEQIGKDVYEDWKLAEEFVKKFYSNIIPSILGSSEDIKTQSMEKVLDVLDWQWRKSDIVNCFEAGIVIYFFDPEFIKCYIEKKNISTIMKESEDIKELEYGIL